VQGFTADVLFSNLGMMKVFRKGGLPIKAELEEGIYHLYIPFYESRVETEPSPRKLRSGENIESSSLPVDPAARAARSHN
jgi:hypothetical protein